MPLHVRWEGPFFVASSLALVNREIVARLSGRDGLRLSIDATGEEGPFAEAAEKVAALRALAGGAEQEPDVHVRHHWPLNPHPPRRGKWVIFQPWEFGSLPRAWHEPMRYGADEVWVYGSHNKRAYVESGIPEEKIRVVPLGVHAALLSEPSPFPLRTEKRFKFLFVGGTIPRKGIDLLLDAYIHAFARADDVCLVVKDFGVESFYRGQTSERLIAELQRDGSLPEIEYLKDDLSPEQLRDLYHACDALVHPYRGEGFGLPIAEAMACGLPVIVPDQGGASDFCTEETALLVPSQRRPIPSRGGLDTLGDPWWVEVRSRDLQARMRELFDVPDQFTEMAARGRRCVSEGFTWARTAAVAGEYLDALGASESGPLRACPRSQHRLRVEAGVALHGAGNGLGALREFTRAREHHEDDDVLYNLAGVLLERQDPATARSLLDRLHERLLPAQGEDASLLAQVRELRDAAGWMDGERREQALRGAERPTILWRAPVFNVTGYADESRHFLLALHAAGDWPVHLLPHDAVVDRQLVGREEFQILEGFTRTETGRAAVEFQHSPPSGFAPVQAPLSVARTMFETDRIPEPWVDWLNRFSEVWVPTAFNRETFARSGLVREKIRIVPGCLDPARYALPATPEPCGPEFRFLSLFDFSPRKGWDLLLRAYCEEFTPSDPVVLVVKVVNIFRDPLGPRQRVEDFLRHHGFRDHPALQVIDGCYAEAQLLDLYRRSDAFVLPSRGEGWGRPYMEAMACGLPTIGTNWSGNLEFMNEGNSYLAEIEGLEPCERSWPEMPLYRGHQWAVPSVASVRQRMREVFENREEAAARGRRAREEILSNFGMAAAGARLSSEFQRLVEGAEAFDRELAVQR